MSYLALYRAWRPQKFEDVIGQDHITKTLKNSLKDKRFSHAYLFSGPRGTGKTSIAKIFAKAVNCESGISEEPCNQCNTCTGITGGSILDVVEIDAASNRGVEEIRDLREKIRFTPTETKYKVYIIDEVHMLTTEAFNALLKTLEEPPSHAIFILATTEPHKLPLTIISRCQRFDFRRISSEKISELLHHIVQSEGLSVEQSALSVIARQSEGGMRDALSLLDQVISFGGKEIKQEDVLRITGRALYQSFSAIAESIKRQDTIGTLNTVLEIIEEGKEPEKILEDLLYYFRDILLYKTAPSLDEMKEKITIDQNLPKIAEGYSENQLYQIIETLNKYYYEIKTTNQRQIILELALIKISRTLNNNQNTVTNDAVAELKSKIEKLESTVERLINNKTDTKPDIIEPGKKHIILNNGYQGSEILDQLKNEFIEKDYQELQKVWQVILQTVREKKVTVYAWLIDGEPVGVTVDKIIIAFNNDMHKNTTDKPTNRELIENVITETIGKKYIIINILQKEWENFNKNINTIVEENLTENDDDFVLNAKDLFGESLIIIKD